MTYTTPTNEYNKLERDHVISSDLTCDNCSIKKELDTLRKAMQLRELTLEEKTEILETDFNL